MAERSNAAVLKTVDCHRSGGSNPSLSAKYNFSVPACCRHCSLVTTFYVYIIYSPVFDRYYIGQTADFEARLQRHNKGIEAATKPYVPWIRKCVIEKISRAEAMILEKKLKNLNRVRLLAFMEKYGAGG